MALDGTVECIVDAMRKFCTQIHYSSYIVEGDERGYWHDVGRGVRTSQHVC
jgi:hypothetical protein